MYIGLQHVTLLIWLKNHRAKTREHLVDRIARQFNSNQSIRIVNRDNCQNNL